MSSARSVTESIEGRAAGHHHNSRHSVSDYDMLAQERDPGMMDVYPSTETAPAHDSLSPSKQVPSKQVSFELLLPQSPQHRARLPMRVNIFPHDSTDSIITTVKNFYGLYERRGVIFEDRRGNILIARYENFDHGMVVYVRVSAEDPDAEDYSPAPRQLTVSPRRPRHLMDDGFQMLPPTANQQLGSRAGSRSGRQSQSPHPRGRRSASAATHSRRNRPAVKSRGNSSHGSFAEQHGEYSDSDGEGSVGSSRRSRKEPLASADISVDNIVEGGRRKRAKFDSSVSVYVSLFYASFLTPAPYSGAPSLRSSSGPDDQLHLVRFSPAPCQRQHGWIAVLYKSADILILSPAAIAAELWAGR